MKTFATYAPHEHVGCVNCRTRLHAAKQGTDTTFTVGQGAKQQECPTCGMQTLYDVLEVHESYAGFYIGLVDPEEGQISRESAHYWPKQHLAITALETGRWPRNRAY